MDADYRDEIMEAPAPDDRHIEMRLGLGHEASWRVTVQPSLRHGEGLGR